MQSCLGHRVYIIQWLFKSNQANKDTAVITGLPLNSSYKIKSPVTARAFEKKRKRTLQNPVWPIKTTLSLVLTIQSS